MDNMESSFRKEQIWNISTRAMSVAVMLSNTDRILHQLHKRKSELEICKDICR